MHIGRRCKTNFKLPCIILIVFPFLSLSFLEKNWLSTDQYQGPEHRSLFSYQFCLCISQSPFLFHYLLFVAQLICSPSSVVFHCGLMQGTWISAAPAICVRLQEWVRVVFSVQWAFLCCWLSLFRWWETDVLALSFFSLSLFSLSVHSWGFPGFQWLKAPWYGSKNDITACYFQYSQSHMKALYYMCICDSTAKGRNAWSSLWDLHDVGTSQSYWKCAVNREKKKVQWSQWEHQHFIPRALMQMVGAHWLLNSGSCFQQDHSNDMARWTVLS